MRVYGRRYTGREHRKKKFVTEAASLNRKPGAVVIFGSGEMSPTGRKIHETVFRKGCLSAPVTIGILETPTGFEVNAIHGWPERMQKFFETGLKNWKPRVLRIRAWRKDGPYSTDNPQIVDAILSVDYLYCGAGSPGYAIRHMAQSRAFRNILAAHDTGRILSLGSATAVALSDFAIPVYEIFKAGADVHWVRGLSFFGRYGLRLAIVPHWNNHEGNDFDTTHCYMGVSRFLQLEAQLPPDIPILGIDEHTAVVFYPETHMFEVMGIGTVHIRKHGGEIIFGKGEVFFVEDLLRF